MPTKWSSNEEQLFDPLLWEDPAEWPRDPPGYVFLARAFDETARAVHGERWIQHVKEPDEPEEPPDDCDDDDTAWDEWDRACDQAQAEFQGLQAKLADMKARVARMIAEQCELGPLGTVARPKRGGEMTALGGHHWNIDDLRRRFFRCEMSLDQPFASHRVSRNDCWIYVRRDDLDRFLMTQSRMAHHPSAVTNIYRHT
jgi:hypothetical protein